MKITIFQFTAKELRSIHSDHLGFLIASSHCCNELTAVMPYIIFEHDLSTANDAEKAFIRLRFYTLVRLQVAKIIEYRDLCNGYIGTIRKTFPGLAEKISDDAGAISRKIQSAKWAMTVRNKVAFHFDTKYALQVLNSVGNETLLKFMVGSIRGLTAFDFADQLICLAMFSDAGNGDESRGQDVVKNWTTELRLQILNFHSDITKDIFQQYGLMKKSEEIEIRQQYCGSRGSDFIPLTTRPSER